MRSLRAFALGVVLVATLPASSSAQRQGALELGALGRITKFADTLHLSTGFGLGGRAGIYIFRNVLAELELTYADVDVDEAYRFVRGADTLKKVSDALWVYRLVYNHPLGDKAALLLGGGYAYDSYGRVRIVAPRGGGPQALVGLRLILNDRLSARFEGTGTFVMPADADTRPVARSTHVNLGAQAGLSVSFFTRPPRPRIDTVRVVQRDTVFVPRIDTVRLAAPVTGGGGAATGAAPATPVVIGAVHFAFNKYDITDEAKKVLDVIAESLLRPSNTSRTITVTGNTDAIGSEGYNEKLGQARADQAKAYLVSRGVSADRIVARTAGETDPLAPNDTDNGRATNRRVLIMLTN
jgi:OOP family OmpA-OmpF porin